MNNMKVESEIKILRFYRYAVTEQCSFVVQFNFGTE